MTNSSGTDYNWYFWPSLGWVGRRRGRRRRRWGKQSICAKAAFCFADPNQPSNYTHVSKSSSISVTWAFPNPELAVLSCKAYCAQCANFIRPLIWLIKLYRAKYGGLRWRTVPLCICATPVQALPPPRRPVPHTKILQSSGGILAK